MFFIAILHLYMWHILIDSHIYSKPHVREIVIDILFQWNSFESDIYGEIWVDAMPDWYESLIVKHPALVIILVVIDKYQNVTHLGP